MGLNPPPQILLVIENKQGKKYITPRTDRKLAESHKACAALATSWRGKTDTPAGQAGKGRAEGRPLPSQLASRPFSPRPASARTASPPTPCRQPGRALLPGPPRRRRARQRAATPHRTRGHPTLIYTDIELQARVCVLYEMCNQRFLSQALNLSETVQARRKLPPRFSIKGLEGEGGGRW